MATKRLYENTPSWQKKNPLRLTHKAGTMMLEFTSMIQCYTEGTRRLAVALHNNSNSAMMAVTQMLADNKNIGEEYNEAEMAVNILQYCRLRSSSALYINDRETVCDVLFRMTQLRSLWTPSRSYVFAGYDMCISDEDFFDKLKEGRL